MELDNHSENSKSGENVYSSENLSLSSRFIIFPEPVLGSSSTRKIDLGTLKPARRSLVNSTRLASFTPSSAAAPGLNTTAAATLSPQCSSGRPKAAASSTAGCS